MAAEPLELAEERRHVAHVAQRGHRVDQRLDRPGAEPVDPLGVHERREQVADLLRVGVQLGALVAVGRDLGEVLDDRVDLLLGHVGQLHERPPARAVSRDVGLGQPAAVDVAEQVVLRPDVGVHALAGVVQNAHAAEISRPFTSAASRAISVHLTDAESRVKGSRDSARTVRASPGVRAAPRPSRWSRSRGRTPGRRSAERWSSRQRPRCRGRARRLGPGQRALSWKARPSSSTLTPKWAYGASRWMVRPAS